MRDYDSGGPNGTGIKAEGLHKFVERIFTDSIKITALRFFGLIRIGNWFSIKISQMSGGKKWKIKKSVLSAAGI